MPTLISEIEETSRLRLSEISPRFWSSEELVSIIISGIKDLWRDIVDLKSEHFITTAEDVTLPGNAASLQNVPLNVHKVYLIEPLDTTEASSTKGLYFKPLDYNDPTFRAARSQAAVDPSDRVLWYAITGQGSPVNAPTIYVSPKVNSAITLRFVYVPTLPSLTAASAVPIPGEADNALVSWTVAYAMAKESESRSPDQNWLQIYATEKQHILHSLGLRQLQEPEYVDALFQDYW